MRTFVVSGWSRGRLSVVALLGTTQILSWGSTYYLPAVLVGPIAAELGWSISTVVGGLSWAMLAGGLMAPVIGRTIDRRGGRPVLAAGSLLIAAGLAALATASGLAHYYLAWTVLGLGAACGLYDAAFATLGHLYGSRARPSITGVTLFGGFASTVAWPAVAAMEAAWGWRDACLVLAAVHLLAAFPAHLLLLPRQAGEAARPGAPAPADPPSATPPRYAFALIAAAFTGHAFVISGVSVHLLAALTALGADAATAIAIGMAIGPAQVAARIVEFTLLKHLHPVWTARLGLGLSFAGLALLPMGGVPLALLGTAVYGAGNGTVTIARGTLPLAVFGPRGYGFRMGLIARSALVAQAVAPVVWALVLEARGPVPMLALGAAIGLAGMLAMMTLRPPRPPRGPPT